MLSQIENGKAFPSVRSLYTLADVLGVPVDYFFPETANNPEPAPASSLAPQMTASDFREAQLNGDAGARHFDATTELTRLPSSTAAPVRPSPSKVASHGRA